MLAAVMLHVGSDGSPCTASIKTLACLSGMNDRNARKLVKRMLDDGVLTGAARQGARHHLTVPSVAGDLGRTGPRSQQAQVAEGTQPRSQTTPEVKEGQTPPVSRGQLGIVGLEGPSEARAQTPPRESARKGPPNPELFSALVAAAGWTTATMTPSQKSRTGKAAKGLASVGATADAVASQALAMEAAWGSPPAPWTVEANWNRTINGRPRRSAPSDWTPKVTA